MFGMLSRLDRMVIRETLRSVGYTLVVVLVLSVFGAALRPLGRGDFDSAGDMAEFLFKFGSLCFRNFSLKHQTHLQKYRKSENHFTVRLTQLFEQLN